MFAAIAPSYDLNNRVHSLGRDQAWRRAAVRAAGLTPGDAVLDVACGTGDLTLAFLDELWRRAGEPGWPAPRPGQVTGVDFTFDMLALARRKAAHRFAPIETCQRCTGQSVTMADHAAFLAGDAMALPVADQSVDVVSIAFGIRNVASPAQALAEFHRVLRPGGRAIVLEFSLPRNALLRGLYQFYFQRVLPRTAGWIARDRTGAYRYLPRSVDTFIDRPAMVELLRQTGFREVAVQPLTFGIAVIYRGIR